MKKMMMLIGAALFGAVQAWGATVEVSTWANLKSNLEAGNSVKLMQSISQENSIVALNGTQNVTLDLNGKTITQYGTSAGSLYVIECSSGSAKVTIKDSVGTGAIVGNANYKTIAGSGGGGFHFLGSSSLTLESGTLKNFRLASSSSTLLHGGCIYVGSSASFTMNGGTISGCSSTGDGGGVFTAGKTAEIYGGSITSCSSSNWGGAIAVDSGKYIYIYGGYFSGNTATSGSPFLDCSSSEKHGYLYGGVYNGFDPTSNNDTVLQYGSVATVGTKRVIGSSIASDSNNKLTAGTYKFDPAGSEYVASGCHIAPAKVATKSGTSWTIGSASTSPFQASTWNYTKINLEAGYSVKLTQSMSQGSVARARIDGKTVTLDLNGYTITGSSDTSSSGRLAYLASSANLTLIDSSSSKTDTINGNNVSRQTGGPCVCVESGCTMTMNGGTVKNYSSTGNGGAIYNAGTFTMNGGTISGCSSTYSGGQPVSDVGGGGVYVASGATFNLNGGTISGCTAAQAGGGVFSYGTVKIDGGTITGSSATYHAGGVCVWAGTFTMNGGTIASCSAKWGGAFHQTAGKTTVNGGSFTSNTATEHGRVFTEDGGTVTINGGYYTAGSSGANSIFYRNTSATCYFYLYGGVCDFQPSAKSTGLTSWGDYSETQVGSKWVVGKSVAKDANNKLTAGTYTFDPAGSEYVASGCCIAPAKVATKSGTTWTINSASTSPFQASTWNYAKINLEAGYSVKLTGNVSQDSTCTIPSSKGTMTLDLNGYTITRTKNYKAFTINSGDTFTIKNGTFDGANYQFAADGHFLYNSGGTTTLEDLTIRNCKNSGNCWGAIMTYSGTMTMKGGRIENCTSPDSIYGKGGAAYISSSGSFLMTNGAVIASCSAGNLGGGVYVNSGTFTLADGTISSCTAVTNGGAVYVTSSGTFNMNGGAITNCTANQGGGLYNTGTATIYGGSIIGNFANTTDGCTLIYNKGTEAIVNVYGGVIKFGAGTGKYSLGNYGKTFLIYGGVLSYASNYKPSDVSVVKVGSNYVYGKDIAFDANNKLTAGTYTFDPAASEYSAAGVALAPGSFTQKTGDLAWQILTGTQIGDTTWGYVKDGDCTVYGSGMVTNAAALRTLGVTNLVIASGVTGIGASVFEEWSSIRDVSFGADCVTISSQAFHDCMNLTNVAFAATGAASIGDHAFFRCNSLEKMSFVAKPTFGEQSYTLQAGIWMKDGLPQIYTIPDITVDGAIKKRVLATENLGSAWTDVTNKSDEERKAYHFFKIVIE